MSMECDTRLSVLALEKQDARPARRRSGRSRRLGAVAASGLAAMVLTLFTRTA